MNDWLKIAKQRQIDDYVTGLRKLDEKRQRMAEMVEAEKNWIERVEKRVAEINAEGFFIHTSKKDNWLRLVNRGEIEIEWLQPLCFGLTYKNILPPTTLLLRTPMLVHHHRLVKLRELNSHNIEEVVKFVVLGMKQYTKLADRSRIENNLDGVIETQKKDDHELTG